MDDWNLVVDKGFQKIDQLILINSLFEPHGENEWLGIIHTLKTYMNDTILYNLQSVQNKQNELVEIMMQKET